MSFSLFKVNLLTMHRLFILILLFDFTTTEEIHRMGCPCTPTDLCTVNHYENHREVTVVTENKSDFKKWRWEGIHNVINANETDNMELVCYAHSKRVNYGILTKMPGSDSSSSADIYSWVDDIADRAQKSYAEFIALDLLELVGNCYMSAEYGERVINLTKIFSRRISMMKRKITCILPWKPPCFQGNCSVVDHLKEMCDSIMTSPESYITECDTNCRAKATMPINNIIIGTDEYLFNHNIEASKLYIGIPWHGYDYKCTKYMGTEQQVCKLPHKPNSTDCDFESARTKMTFYDLETLYPQQYEENHKWSKLYNSRYFVVNKTNDGVHEIWYEADESLYEKYKFALDMQLRGVVIWTADDLANYDKGDAREWNWLIHSMMVIGEKKDPDLSMAFKAMAIGVGCFIGGCIVGAIITTLIARRQMKLMNRSYKPPFHKDDIDDDETANFHEDDKYL